MDICINPLAAAWQFTSKAAIELGLTEIVNCFVYCLPALQHKRARLIYDDLIEKNGLMRGGAGFVSDINQVRNRDIARQWFLFVKNRSVRAESEPCMVSLVGTAGTVEIAGEIRRELVQINSKWLSFRGTPFSERVALDISSETLGIRLSLANAWHLISFKAWWPEYQPSEKHRKEGYWRAGGEWVSPMPLNNDQAQAALLTSVLFGNERFSAFGNRYFRFLRTYPDKNIYHGFEVDWGDLPNQVILGLSV
jgi:hypothetical protein